MAAVRVSFSFTYAPCRVCAKRTQSIPSNWLQACLKAPKSTARTRIAALHVHLCRACAACTVASETRWVLEHIGRTGNWSRPLQAHQRPCGLCSERTGRHTALRSLSHRAYHPSRGAALHECRWVRSPQPKSKLLPWRNVSQYCFRRTTALPEAQCHHCGIIVHLRQEGPILSWRGVYSEKYAKPLYEK